MDTQQAERLIEQATRSANALERIAKVLELMVQPPPAPTKCLHPVDKRIDFGVTNGHEDWQCGVCKWRSVKEDGTPAEDR